jgi:hypothetical protein
MHREVKSCGSNTSCFVGELPDYYKAISDPISLNLI